MPGEEAIALVFKMKSCITQAVLKKSKIAKFCYLIPDSDQGWGAGVPTEMVWCLSPKGKTVPPTLIYLFNQYLLSTYSTLFWTWNRAPNFRSSCASAWMRTDNNENVKYTTYSYRQTHQKNKAGTKGQRLGIVGGCYFIRRVSEGLSHKRKIRADLKE